MASLTGKLTFWRTKKVASVSSEYTDNFKFGLYRYLSYIQPHW